ncbi:unnamed protein product [Camellia sinensis]
MSSHNNSSSSAANDPRQPSAAKPFASSMVSPQELPIDYSGFIAVICAVAGVMFRGCTPDGFAFTIYVQYKLGSWLAIIFCAQSLANMKNMENDLKQISMAMMGNSSALGLSIIAGHNGVSTRFAIMGLMTNYFGPARPAPPQS